ncbi:DUF6308 family protein [Mycolicibacterium sp. GCM10028919]|uniref:DUF6308 family protein n=1 Tax=Mycolicibacterium sp. GCM10028919 TaxID=3273401 RepID=UPI00361593C5
MAEFEYTQWRHRWPEAVVQRRTDEAVELLTRYYAVTAAGRPAYSGSRFEAMAALNSDPYSIGPADFTAASMLSVDIPAQAAIRLLSRDASDITALLHRIPVDVDIINIDLDDFVTGGPASLLWQLLRRGNDGMGRTRTSKLIAAKRPRLLPIWDSFVEQATGLDTVNYWRQFQAVLAADDHAIWTWLTQIRSDVPNVPAAVSNLRILDVLLWMTVDQQR